jgi:hypothetical protein
MPEEAANGDGTEERRTAGYKHVKATRWRAALVLRLSRHRHLETSFLAVAGALLALPQQSLSRGLSAGSLLNSHYGEAANAMCPKKEKLFR